MGDAAPAFVVIVAAIVGALVAGLVRRGAIRRGAVVPPRPDRWHRTPTPTFGGIAILAGLAAGLLLRPAAAGDMGPLLAAAGALFIAGWYDDVKQMTALEKMVSSLGVAAFFVYTLTRVNTTPEQAALAVAAILWFGAIDNAINLLDNMDGLAAGVTAMASLALALTFHAELGPVIVVPLALVGALLGFLVWNRHPAKLFMGNCGSLMVGGIVAGTATMAVARAGTVRAAIAAVLILVVPIFDTTFVVLLRRLAGRSTTRGNIDHMSHRLVSAGFSEPGAVATLCGVGVVGGGAGYLIYVMGAPAWPVAATVMIAALMMALYLARVPAYAGQDFQALQGAPFAPILSDLTFRWHAGEVLLDMLLIATCYYAAYRVRFEGQADLPVFLASFAVSLPAILGCQLAGLYSSGLYSRMWSTFGLHDLATVLRGVGTGTVLSVLTVTYLYKFERFSRSVFLIDAVMLTIAILATRSSFRIFGRLATRTGSRQRRTVIYGAGANGRLLAREMLANPAWDRTPVAFIDDNASIHAQRIVGVPVRGCVDDLAALLDRARIDEVLLSSPAINGPLEARVIEICRAHRVDVRRLYFEIR